MPEGVERGVEVAALQQAKEVRNQNNRSRCRRFASRSRAKVSRGARQGEGRAGRGRRAGGRRGGREDEPAAPGHVQEEASQAPLGES